MKPEDFGITKYKFRADGLLDVFEHVDLSERDLKKLPFKFGKVSGNFDCDDSKELRMWIKNKFKIKFNSTKANELYLEVLDLPQSCKFIIE